MKLTLIIFYSAFLLINFSNKTEKKGIEIYISKAENPILGKSSLPDCDCCSDLSLDLLDENPILSEKDIINFNWKKQIIIITDEAKNRLFNLNHSVYGFTTVLLLDGKPMFSILFMSNYSSNVCIDAPYMHQPSDNILNIRRNWKAKVTRKDPRNIKALKSYVKKKYKQ